MKTKINLKLKKWIQDLEAQIQDLEAQFNTIYNEATSSDIKKTLFDILTAIASNCNDKTTEKDIYIYINS